MVDQTLLEQFISGSPLLQLGFFIIWSGALSALTLVIGKFSPKIIQWSRFWQVWLITTLLPLLPISFNYSTGIIPESLKSAFSDSQQNLMLHSNSVVTRIESSGALQNFIFLVMLILVLGTCVSLFRFSLGVVKVNKLLSQASNKTDLKVFSPRQQQIIANKRVRILVTDCSVSPFVFGFFRVSLVLPQSVFTMPAAQQALLIDHELMHIKRQDPKAVILFRFCSSLFWFNPFVSFMEQRFLQTMELNCDSAVISANPASKLNYARALIASLKLNKSTFDSGVTSYFSGPGFNKQDFENRIKLAMSGHANKRLTWRARVALVLLSSAIGCFAMAAKPFLSLQGFDQFTGDGIVPVLSGRISSGYDDISDFRGNRPHQGIDIAAPIGTNVVASFSGWVIIADDITLHQNYGKVVLIEHEGQTQSLYAHLNTFSVESGQYISAGEKIGTVGATGRVTGPHLHFEVLESGKHANPENYLDLASLSAKAGRL
ncbi:M23/M56 family metallopeptidase [Colwellia piezophila]|uniref:M23/M56 family metallopeptidase n=1 Tax=Colwellia piezophila TaxID=211668 RepID=UPI0003647DA3|nr:M23/M56 family metallopeptidase [Colwellia piezophila]